MLRVEFEFNDNFEIELIYHKDLVFVIKLTSIILFICVVRRFL